MGQVQQHPPVLLVLTAFSRYESAWCWAAQRAAEQWGPIALRAGPYAFADTSYYAATMGTDLQKVFFAFERLVDPADLPAIKLTTNRWEQEYATRARHSEARPLNLDPGYLTPAKFVLASTKDFAHRIYLGCGIYAEITLRYERKQGWQPLQFTFPDYRRGDYRVFFDQCRAYLQAQRRKTAGDDCS
jgi:hypothetical protein